jgi:hypothetical protein
MSAPWADEDVLLALDMVERQGMSMVIVARRMRRTRKSLVELIGRVNRDCDAVPCLATAPENCDGGMPVRWWLDRRVWA